MRVVYNDSMRPATLRMLFLQICIFVSAFNNLQKIQAKSIVKPNILVIIADDLGWSDLGCYGADLHETPILDQFAHNSIRFTNAYSASPVCSPTRAALMTGLHPARLGITIWSEGARKPDNLQKLIPGESLDHLPLKYQTLAEKLSSIGYRTASIGKWHLGDTDQAPETQGFDINIGGTRWGAPGTFFWPFKNDKRFGGEYRYIPGLTFGKTGDYLTDQLTNKALEVIDQANDQPFFLYLAHYAPHTPIEAPELLTEKYRQKIRPEYNHQNPTYAAMIENLDTNIGRIFEHLKKNSKFDQTMILFTSDNGGYLGDTKGRNGIVTTNNPLRSGKGSLYEGGIRVPLLMKLPYAAKSGCIMNQRVVTTDLHHTLLNIAGYQEKEPKDQQDGITLLPMISSAEAEWPDRPLYFHYPHYYETTEPVSCIIHKNYKLLHYAEDQKTELYDLTRDPYETSNIVHAELDLAMELKLRLQEWKHDVKAKEPRKNPDYQVKQK